MAINKDPEAPIFQGNYINMYHFIINLITVADYGLVADLFKVSFYRAWFINLFIICRLYQNWLRSYSLSIIVICIFIIWIKGYINSIHIIIMYKIKPIKSLQ